jgi:hypothetical protein
MGVVLSLKAAMALKSGRIRLGGWAFEDVVAERAKYWPSYWYMTVASALMGALGIGAGIYELLFASS